MLNYAEWLGYAASLVVAVSLLMSSIVRLRWINLAGALMFGAYGLLIRAYPVALLNFLIAGINVWHLGRIHRQRDRLCVVSAGADSALLTELLREHADGIRRFFPHFDPAAPAAEIAFFTLRNAHVAGIVLARHLTPDTLLVTLDYVLPEYRDFKIGRFVYERNAARFRALGVSRLASEPHSAVHRDYLRRMGFVPGRVAGRDLLVRAVG